MKALVRDKEVYPETAWSPFTRNHLEWHCTAKPDGDGYALADNCPADAVGGDFDITVTANRLTATLNTRRYNARPKEECEATEPVIGTAISTVTETEADVPETIVVDGVTYTRSS